MSHVHDFYLLPDYCRTIRANVAEFAYVCAECGLNVTTLAPGWIETPESVQVANQVTLGIWGGRVIGVLTRKPMSQRQRWGDGGYLTISELRHMCGVQ